ncbi:hypothetical protein Mapa_004692 [Marchantia paleacea]|nr:hypothetical protein Mapa_004692 [Marchantia paleacea]
MAQESMKALEETGCQPPDGPILCAKNCGFYGTADAMNLCSKCYQMLAATASSDATPATENDMLISESKLTGQFPRQNTEQSGCDTEAPPVGETSNATTSGGSSSTATAVVADDSTKRSSHGPKRCFSCRKRVGLTGFDCKCGNLYCSLHRYSDKHNCTFDYKTAGRDAIAQANPVVKADKIEKV